MTHSPSQAKNVLKKAFYQIIDVHPTTDEIMEMISYFRYECAYCGFDLSYWQDVDKDHIVPSSITGTNGIANRVPSCKDCNSKKRDTQWEEFLRSKCNSDAEYTDRQQTIVFWMMTSSHQHREIPQDLLQLVENEVDRLKSEIDHSVNKIRELKKQHIEQGASLGRRKKTRRL